MDSEAPLFDPAFVTELEALKRRLETRVRSGQLGERTARRRGGSAEFAEHRAYAPGDDPRRMDWAAYARTAQPVVKLYRAEEDSLVRLTIDASASLRFGTPSKLLIAQRTAAAIAYLAFSSGERVQLVSTHGDRDRGTVINPRKPRRGRSGFAAFLAELGTLTPSGQVDLCRALELLLKSSARPGLLVLISDFFETGQLMSALARARQAGHDLRLLQVLEPAELEPNLRGDVTLVDAESGQEVAVSLDAAALDAYALRLTGLVEELRSFARRHGASYTRVMTTDALDGALRRFVGREVD
jgi:uncharacterized protein (DUF58 family)